jgi:polysaccharide biosynthesis/export protein VpsN
MITTRYSSICVFAFATCMRLVVLVSALGAQESMVPSAETFTLQAGDVLRVEIWREDDLSGDFPVDEMGIVTLPLLGDKDVNGVPLRDLRDQLVSEYRIQLRNPSISITPLRRVHVLGNVNQPGMYMIDPTVSLAGAVALAGGASAQGDLRRLRIARGGEIIRDGVPAEATLAQIDVQSGDQLFVERRGWFERNQNFLISTMVSVTVFVASFLR